jgi:hypothetical protein
MRAFCSLWCKDPNEGILIETYDDFEPYDVMTIFWIYEK